MKTVLPTLLLFLASIHGIRAEAWMDVVYGQSGDGPLLLNVHVPEGDGPFPWLLRFSSAREKPDALGQRLLAEGYALIYAAYDVETSGRVYPPWPQAGQAVLRGITFLKAHAERFRLDPARGGAWGWSRGASAAALAANCGGVDVFHGGEAPEISPDLRVCVALSGTFGRVPQEMLGLDLGLYPRPGHNNDPASSVSAWLHPAMPPTLLFRGGNDGSPEDVRAFHAALRAMDVPSEIHILPGAGHGLGGDAVLQPLLQWLDLYLKPAEVPERFPEDPLALLLKAELFDAARNRFPAQLPAIQSAEAAALRRSIEEDLPRPPVYWRSRVKRWRALGGVDAALEARIAEREAAAAEAIAARRADDARKRAENQDWPRELPVPAWAEASGADGYGLWALLRVKTPNTENALRFRRLPGGSWLAEIEVTQALYHQVTGLSPSHFQNKPTLPVERVSHAAALAFCDKLREMRPTLRVRLPLSDEWRSASAPEDAVVLEATGWYVENSGGHTHPAGSLTANSLGFFDLAGNVFEWLGDARKTKPAHYRSYAGGSFASRPERCDPEWITAHNGENTTFYHGIRILLEP